MFLINHHFVKRRPDANRRRVKVANDARRRSKVCSVWLITVRDDVRSNNARWHNMTLLPPLAPFTESFSSIL